jgi:alkylation response protein AidB-like acyl-CoA dehydrogenase
VIRAKLGNMIRQIESCQAWLEQLTHQMCVMEHLEANMKLGGSLALLKVQSTTVLEFCAREAVQIFGGLGYTRGGQGEKVERIYRECRAMAILGGSEEVMLDLGVRQAMRMNKSKL